MDSLSIIDCNVEARLSKKAIMKILFFGKWPPIQGGVSRESYLFVRSLADRGHRVHVV